MCTRVRVHVGVRMLVRACLRACVRTCVRTCMRARDERARVTRVGAPRVEAELLLEDDERVAHKQVRNVLRQ